MAVVADYKQIAQAITAITKQYNYHIAPKQPHGGTPTDKSYAREFRLQLINSQNDTSDLILQKLPNDLKKITSLSNVKVNSLSSNSSKFPSIEFHWNGSKIDVVVARGANRGENFEKSIVNNLADFFGKGLQDEKIVQLMDQLNKANPSFAKVEIAKAAQRVGSTKKENVKIEDLGAIIGDIVLTDTANEKWYVSLKDINGFTFSSYSGAASLFNKDGELQFKSAGADFLNAFGVDLNEVQSGFDERNNIKTIRKKLPVEKPSKFELKKIFERAWGMNYFYVKRESFGWKVFWIDRDKLNKLTNVTVEKINYPNKSSKQISIICSSPEYNYIVEIRNSKGGEYPNDTKFKIR